MYNIKDQAGDDVWKNKWFVSLDKGKISLTYQRKKINLCLIYVDYYSHNHHHGNTNGQLPYNNI